MHCTLGKSFRIPRIQFSGLGVFKDVVKARFQREERRLPRLPAIHGSSTYHVRVVRVVCIQAF